MIERETNRSSIYPKSSEKDAELIEILTSAKSFKLLKVMLYKPGYEMYQKEIIKGSGLSPNTAVPLLNKLTAYGILKENIVAGTKFYSIVKENPVLKQFKILVNVSNIYELTRELPQDVEIYLFGSAARGEDYENSDIDLLIIANGDKEALSKIKEDVKERLTGSLYREVNPVVYTPIGYSNLYNKEKAFYESIEKDKIRVK